MSIKLTDTQLLMLSAAAQRIEPAPVRHRRRWPLLAAGLYPYHFKSAA